MVVGVPNHSHNLIDFYFLAMPFYSSFHRDACKVFPSWCGGVRLCMCSTVFAINTIAAFTDGDDGDDGDVRGT